MRAPRLHPLAICCMLAMAALAPNTASAADPSPHEKSWSSAPDKPAPSPAPKAIIKLPSGPDDYLRLITWHQVWGRVMQLNPGTTIQGTPEEVAADIGLRRSRFVALGKVGDVQVVTHFGINNQTFNNQRKPQLFMHDVWGSYTFGRALTLGSGLHYFNGVSRMTNASTLNFLAVDAPILNWPTIEATDQFARRLGFFAKGKLAMIDYRVAIDRPFTSGFDASADPTPGAAPIFNQRANSFAYSGYFNAQLFDEESNLLPYTVGTYLGTKRVLNIGLGAHYQPDGMASADTSGDLQTHDILAIGADVFADLPMGKGSALTAYLVYYHYDFGPDFVRNIGIMNIGAGGTSFAGGGNKYPVMGTGNHVYTQLGYLLPGDLRGTKLQPYATTQVSMMDALDDPMVVVEGGLNWYVSGQNFKLTPHYRNRPIFEQSGDQTSASGRASELILQMAVML